MLNFKCDSCGDPISQPGALVFSPPVENAVRKFHVCTVCFKTKVEPLLQAIFSMLAP